MGNKVKKEFSDDFFPFKISWLLTTACSLNCSYCFLPECVREKQYKVIDIVETLNVMRVWGVFNLEILGGEPFIDRNRLQHLIELTKDAPPFITRISTNGTIYDPKIVTMLVKLPYLKQFQVSLDASCEATYKIIRGANFNKVIKNVELFVKSGLPVTLSMVLDKDNFKEIHNFVKLGEVLGVSGVSFDGLMCNTTNQTVHNNHLSFHEMLEIKKDLRNIKSDKLKIQINECNKTKAPCMAGTSEMAMMPNGDLYPCAVCIEDESFVIGNILTGINKFASKKLANFMNYKIFEECSKCQLPSICDGACRYINMLAKGNSYNGCFIKAK